MQEDLLLSGSIADNICFYDPSFDEERMIKCANLAGIHEEIMTMPMTYNSLVGDMGSSLSGGQKQRIMLARALYRQPQILGEVPFKIELGEVGAERLARRQTGFVADAVGEGSRHHRHLRPKIACLVHAAHQTARLFDAVAVKAHCRLKPQRPMVLMK